jgi:hypothetical protein
LDTVAKTFAFATQEWAKYGRAALRLVELCKCRAELPVAWRICKARQGLVGQPCHFTNGQLGYATGLPAQAGPLEALLYEANKRHRWGYWRPRAIKPTERLPAAKQSGR